MVDVGGKDATERMAEASAVVRMNPATMERIRQGTLAKGNVLEVARLAGIMAAKKTADLIPLCHPLPLTSVSIDFTEWAPDRLRILARAKVFARTAVTISALTIYDMCKAIDRGMIVEQIRLEAKSGGQSGIFQNTVSE